jgi:intein-encoded DNA endonuclease-like protein
MPIYKKINKDFFKVWSHDMAYVLGFFAADGYITHNKRGALFWGIQITDKELLFIMRDILGSDHTINIRIRSGNENTLYRLQIGSKEMVEDLAQLGFFARKTNNIQIPVMHKKYLPDFIRGYFDGDGNVWSGYMNKNREKWTKTILVAFTSNSEDFLVSLHDHLKSNGIKGGSVRMIKNKKSYRLTLSTTDSLKIFKIMYTRDTPLQLLRKKVVFERFIENMRS